MRAYNTLLWYTLCMFNLIGLAFLGFLAIVVSAPVWIPLYLLSRFLEWYSGETMEELDRIIGAKHNTSRRLYT